jgi:hypothetical protein
METRTCLWLLGIVRQGTGAALHDTLPETEEGLRACRLGPLVEYHLNTTGSGVLPPCPLRHLSFLEEIGTSGQYQSLSAACKHGSVQVHRQDPSDLLRGSHTHFVTPLNGWHWLLGPGGHTMAIWSLPPSSPQLGTESWSWGRRELGTLAAMK